MSSKREDVSITGTKTDDNIGFTFEELQAELRRFHEANHARLGPGEFVTIMYAEANHITRDRAKSIIQDAVKSGKMINVGYRCVDDRRCVAYKLVK